MNRMLLGAALAASVAGPAAAERAAGDSLRGFIDIRLAAADGEHSWLDRGMGKTRFGGAGAGQGWTVEPALATAALVWNPQLSWSLDFYLHLQATPEQDHAIDASEAFLSYRAPPIDRWRLTARAGLFYPPVSLEHEDDAWRVAETIAPSAINSWIGEEVKVAGAEASLRRRFGDQETRLTLSAFGYNDTSGTLLSWRGWALHDVQATASGDLPLPERSAAWWARRRSQAPDTEPVRELDDRVGYYVRAEWRPAGNLAFSALHYDNEGDRISREDGQSSWETRFTNVGLRAALDDDTRLLAQIMNGQTIWGRATSRGYWVDMDFRAAYVLMARDFGRHTLAGRLDIFETIDRSFVAEDNNNEVGWAATAAYQVDLTPQFNLAIEAMHVSSDRPARLDVGAAAEQEQTTLQSALRIAF